MKRWGLDGVNTAIDTSSIKSIIKSRSWTATCCDKCPVKELNNSWTKITNVDCLDGC
jgi:hypothetical protein